MIKNRTAQLVWRAFFLGIAAVGVAASLGLFDMAFRWDFYIYFTNLSNYLCIGVLAAQLVGTARRQGDGFCSAAPAVKLASLTAILVTFLIYNFVLAREAGRDPARNFTAMSILLHVVLPVLYVSDWVLFEERGRLRWRDALAALFFPAGYLVYVFAHAALRGFDSGILGFVGSNPLIYPYFFLNIDTYGVPGVAVWCLLLALAFTALGLIFVALDKLLGLCQKRA